MKPLKVDSCSAGAEDEKSKTAGQTYKKTMCSLGRNLARPLAHLASLPHRPPVPSKHYLHDSHTQPLCLWFAQICLCQSEIVAREEVVRGPTQPPRPLPRPHFCASSTQRRHPLLNTPNNP